MVLASLNMLNDQKQARYPLVLKCIVTSAQPLHLVILNFFNGNSCQMIGTCILILRSDVDGLTHAKQLLYLLCIV